EVAQELPLLPGRPQQDEGILELLVELLDLGVDLQRLVRPAEVDEAADEVVAGDEQEMGILLVVDERERLVEDTDRALRIPRVEHGGSLLDHRAGEEVALAELPVDLFRLLAHPDRLRETSLEDGQRRASRQQSGAQLRIAGTRFAIPLSGREGFLRVPRFSRDTESVAVLSPGPRLQVGEPQLVTHVDK